MKQTAEGNKNDTTNSEAVVKSLKKTGAKLYRFSVSWDRIIDGTQLDENAINNYKHLIDELKKYKIQPVVTIFNRFPKDLRDRGGWISDSVVEDYENFAKIIFENFAEDIRLFTTINNPFNECKEYRNGIDEYKCAKNILLAHARAWRLYDNKYRKKYNGKVGIGINVDWKDASSTDEEDKIAAEEARQLYFGIYAYPIFSKNGDFPSEVKYIVSKKSIQQGYDKSRLPALTEEEIRLLRGSSDFFGVSHFTSNHVRREKSVNSPSFDDDVGIILTTGEQWVKSDLEWLTSAPYGLYRALLWINTNYDYPEILITEIGWSSPEGMNDEGRVRYLRSYSDALLLALEDGSRVVGMTIWSLIDLENERFGIYQYSNGELRAKHSALVYQEIIRSRKVDYGYEPVERDSGPERLKLEL